MTKLIGNIVYEREPILRQRSAQELSIYKSLHDAQARRAEFWCGWQARRAAQVFIDKPWLAELCSHNFEDDYTPQSETSPDSEADTTTGAEQIGDESEAEPREQRQDFYAPPCVPTDASQAEAACGGSSAAAGSVCG